MLPTVRSRTGTAIASDFASAIGAPIVGDTSTGSLYWYANGSVVPLNVVNVKGYGSTTDVTKVNQAISDVSAAGGGIVFMPAGTYTYTSSIIPKSNVRIMGEGMEATKIVNTASSSPSNLAFDARGVLGANYAINAATEGALTVTTTAAGDSFAFHAGDLIGISGDFFGQDWVPFWITTVASVNYGTGVITLSERLRRADISKVHVITSQISNFSISDLSITSTGDGGIVYKYTRNARIDRVFFGAGIHSAGTNIVGSREVTIDGCIADAGKSPDMHSTIDSNITNCIIRSGSLSLEGGCDSVTIANNHIYDTTTYGVKLDTQCQRCIVAENTIANVAANNNGVFIDGSALVASGGAGGFGGQLVYGNSLTGGALGGNNGVGISGASANNVVVGNRIHGFGVGVTLFNAITSIAEANIYSSCGTELVSAAGSMADHAYTAHFRTAGGVPTIAVGAGAGAGNALISGTDAAGTILVTTGVGPAASAIVATITFKNPYQAAPEVTIVPTDATTTALTGTAAMFVKRANTTTTKFEIWVGAAALATPVQYNFSYHVLQAS